MYICVRCGSGNVESLSWMDLNTGEVENDDETGEYFCRDCNQPTDVEFVSSNFDEDLADEIQQIQNKED